ncbi:hypothetical protein BHE97_13005 [Aeromicrobium sp. PE09-221]|uniref:hypothetical protein n=1 Tax=Aeromicrobium sp. PE09-221 TaxID=1898043 RepID=UPI000B3E882E|nr:hypothetical protein [Aeromicrobium sp. PE09-221]OUZ08588.1 hypothetical protein BHE97_13005 [Aeromicrobium sp. PE09-221]
MYELGSFARLQCTRAGLRGGIPVAPLGLAYFATGVACAGMAQTGDGWWYLRMAVCWWTTLKLIGNALYATVILPTVRAQENLAVRRAIREEQRVAANEDQPRQVWTRDRRLQLTRKYVTT